jgi:preprotein translocase subunit SecB
MKIRDVHKSVLKMKNLYIKDVTFSRDEMIGNSELEISIDPKMEVLNEKEAVFELSVSANNDKNQFNLAITVTAIMEKSDKSPEWDELKPNGFAIVSPYLRSQISILTAQPGFVPIVLPVFNINKIIEDTGNQGV